MTALMKLRYAATAAIAVFGILAGAAQADELADIKAAGEINIGIFSDFPPFSSASADMSIKGYDVDVAQKIADGLGVKLNLVSVTGQNRIAYLNDDRVDLLMSVGYSKERAEVIDFAAPYAPYYIAVIGPAALKVSGKEDLADKTVAVNRGTLEDTSLTAAAPRFGRDPAFRELQFGHPGLHIRPDPVDGRRQRCRCSGSGTTGRTEAGAEIPAPQLALAHRTPQGRGRPEEGRQ